MASNWNEKSELEKTVTAGIHGVPQLKADERRRHLGFFRERVIEAVTFDQIKSKAGLSAVKNALKDNRADELVVHSRARLVAMSCIAEARKYGVGFTITSDPKLVGKIAVIVAAKTAVTVDGLLADQE